MPDEKPFGCSIMKDSSPILLTTILVPAIVIPQTATITPTTKTKASLAYVVHPSIQPKKTSNNTAESMEPTLLMITQVL